MKNNLAGLFLFTALSFFTMVTIAQSNALKKNRAASFYLSPSGNDKNNGSIQQPFFSFKRVMQEVKILHGQQPVTVFLRGGIYYLPGSLMLNAAYSGTVSAPVIFQAYQQEIPIISGGNKLKLHWQPYKNGIMMAKVPVGSTTDQLFVNGEKQLMARYPNYNPNAEYYNGTAADAFSPERVATWADPKGGFIHAMHKAMWGDYHYLITGKKDDSTLTYIGGWQNNRQMGMHNERKFVENIFEELDAPNEWFLNTKTNTLYYFPPVGLDINKATIEVVRLKELVEFKGDEKQPVKYITFKGIIFRHAARTFMDNKEPLLRSDWTTYRGGAIFMNGTENCSIEDCIIDQVGGNGIYINNYNRNVIIKGCHIYKAGANGISFIGDSKAVRSPLFEYEQTQSLDKIDRVPGPQTNNYPAECLVDNCLIHEIGTIEKQSAAVEIEMSINITVRYCSIYNLPRAGINIGSGCWGGHIVEHCDIFNTVKETGDHGSFNSWGRDRFWMPKIEDVNKRVEEVPGLPFLDVIHPIILRNNRWRCDHGWDIDLDDGSTNYEIYNNLCLNGGIKNREGYKRNVYNNIIVNNSFHPHVWYHESGDIFSRNIVFTSYKPIRVPSPFGKVFDYNFLQVLNSPVRPAETLQKQSGRDEHSLSGDALFVDVEKGDYRLKENSPVFGLGFKSFALDSFGVQKPSLKAIAKTPLLTKDNNNQYVERDNKVFDWLGMKVRNILNEGEMSTYGTAGITGVLIIEVPAATIFFKAGIQKNDVILAIDGKKANSVSDLEKIASQLSKNANESKIKVIRNQKEITFVVFFK